MKIRLRDDLTVTFPEYYTQEETDKWLAQWYKNNNKLH